LGGAIDCSVAEQLGRGRFADIDYGQACRSIRHVEHAIMVGDAPGVGESGH